MENKVIIAGSRTFDDYLYLENVMNLLNIDIDEIISGKANGADTLGEQYANNHNIKIKEFYPDWDKFGKSAGHIRNKEMAEYGNILVAFWDGKSSGTKNMINTAKKLNLILYEIRY